MARMSYSHTHEIISIIFESHFSLPYLRHRETLHSHLLSDVSAAYKNLSTLSYGKVVRDLVGSVGLTKSGLDKLFAPSPAFKDEIQRLNPQNKSLFDLKNVLYHTQLQHPEQLSIVQSKILSLIVDAMRADNLPRDIDVPGFEERGTVSLYKLCQQVFVEAGIRAFFGEKILEIDADLLTNFINFDNDNWMIWYNWPKASLARDPMEKVRKTIERYLMLPKSERPESTWLVSTMEEAQRQLDMEEGDIAIVLLMFMWVKVKAFKIEILDLKMMIVQRSCKHQRISSGILGSYLYYAFINLV